MAITIEEITDGTLGGSGDLDKLISALRVHIQNEFDEGRITNEDYATVLLGAIQTGTAQAIQFVLQKGISTAQIALVEQQTLNAVKEGQLLDAQIAKAQAEEALLNQKLKTEQAAILDTVDGNPVAGTVGKQTELYAAQISGFERDAEQKAASAFSNIFSVIYSTDPDAISPSSSGVGETEIKAVMDQLRTGIGLTV